MCKYFDFGTVWFVAQRVQHLTIDHILLRTSSQLSIERFENGSCKKNAIFQSQCAIFLYFGHIIHSPRIFNYLFDFFGVKSVNA